MATTPSEHDAASLPILAIGILTLGGIIGAGRQISLLGDPKPTIVITPEGFVEYINSRRPVKSFAFAHLQDLRLRVQTTTTHTGHQIVGGGTYYTSSTSTATWLDLIGTHGKTARWSPRAGYGRKSNPIQSVIDMFGVYKSMQAMPASQAARQPPNIRHWP